ncbi:4-hydroxy-3-methylbut-2-enyl diphosphate reductase [Sneathiella sp. HT1-7]|jgi:4-hydroxy-3-methylbut-2-enyl diphosphate reductase|uniref:4-hydroxy-3-methylbut-2-enyl diphosphate reductase n=1 Tax=Sneathiella sp. HT1-7 TaxID=2887192 RepID=UPI001D15A05A|nr:4-hydroxy-3-methylbut-2-enyl diphosphate reductase [Sneathiella sp. HT1-7]MCC3303407.1 4-hydroxy-3-methylbut-2-enyl diphosphate reductase [Sneathiella sp. HT1-7]
MDRSERTLLLAAPRGFCAGVDRAIQIVERALEKYGAPVYVRHEIVHNRFVVENLEKKGAVFVDELADIPKDVPVIFSAHGVAKSVPAEAENRKMFYIDATCPLVSKVHREAERHERDNHEIILIGHRGHPEVIGTMGQLAEGQISLIETAEEARSFTQKQVGKSLAYLTQTTLSVDETAEIVGILKKRFPSIESPRKEDICYATTNRQAAVKILAERCDGMLVIGAPNSSNSMRLVEVAEKSGCRQVALVQRASDIPWDSLQNAFTIGITAGASAPETLVEEVVEAFSQRFSITVEEIVTNQEQVVFKMPKILEPEAMK